MNLFEKQSCEFITRHIGPDEHQTKQMLKTIGEPDIDGLVSKTVPPAIRMQHELNLPSAMSEHQYLQHIKEVSMQNKVYKNYIGQGYYDTIIPSVILRNVFENPGWYTQYTPYQAEISQGRLESLLNFQTMVSDLTALPIANASLLDEGTAAAEAMALTMGAAPHHDDPLFLVDELCHPQTIAVVTTRAEARGVKVVVGPADQFRFGPGVAGCLLQYPDTLGIIRDYSQVVEQAHAAKALVTVATDLLALALLKPPGEWGADIAVGNSRRF